MNTQELTRLLRGDEGPALEFKREIYRLDDENSETKKRQRDELIKDILALANGNAVTAGDKAYLIIGADDELNIDGSRDLYDVGKHTLTRTRILDIVNSACEPSIEDVLCEQIEAHGKSLLAITVLPTPYLHETTRRLETPSSSYGEHTVLVRHGKKIDTASQKEREAIILVKRFRFEESKNPPAIPFGAIIGGSIGATVAYSFAANRSKLPDIPGSTLTAGIVGLIFGGFVGGSIGSIYRSFYELRSEWSRVPSALRLPLILLGALASIGGTTLLNWLFRQKRG